MARLNDLPVPAESIEARMFGSLRFSPREILEVPLTDH